MIDRLKGIYGEDLKIISHWGSEPSLTIKYFKDFYRQAVEEFPNLTDISFSSNFLQKNKVDDIVDFIVDFPDDKRMAFNIQLSLDGPKWITDENRRGGATENIVENIVYFIGQINQYNIKHSIKTHFKPTMSRYQYGEMINYDVAKEYYAFFDDVCNRMIQNNTSSKVNISVGCDPTIVCPDDYTTQDGLNFNRMYETIIEVGKNEKFKRVKPDLKYYNALKKIVFLGDELFNKSKMFTCSAGDTQFGVSEYLHPCHDTFYLPYDEIDNATKVDTDRIHSERDSENVDSKRLRITKNLLCKKIDDCSEKEIVDYLYLLRGFHDFFKCRLSIAVAFIKELAYAGQVSECYKYDEMAEVLATFVLTRHSCPTGQMQNLGSINLCQISYFRLFGNGLVENFIKRFLKEQ